MSRLYPFVPPHIEPTARQHAALNHPAKTLLFGGAAGSGKSLLLLMASLRGMNAPGYKALIIRPTFTELRLAGALLDVAEEWLLGAPGIEYERGAHTFRNVAVDPPARLVFGHCADAGDERRYLGTEWHSIAFDEAVDVRLDAIQDLFGRGLRAPLGAGIKQYRALLASNPGFGDTADWLREHFVNAAPSETRAYLPARIADNPHIYADYTDNLREQLSPLRLAQLLEGDWSVLPDSGAFTTANITRIAAAPASIIREIIGVDWAAGTSATADATAMVVLGLTDSDEVVVKEVARGRWAPERGQAMLRELCGRHPAASVVSEIEPGASGLHFHRQLRRDFAGVATIHAVRPHASKAERALAFASAVGRGRVRLVEGPWAGEFLRELAAFPDSRVHDDQVDAAVHAYNMLSKRRGVVVTSG